MNCFNHREEPAIGICKSCGKALCANCLSELPNGIACKNSCEVRVGLLNRIIDANSQVLSVQRGYVRRHTLLCLFFGLGLIVFAIVSYPYFATVPLFPWFFAAAGCLYTAYGALALRRKGQYPNPNEPKP